MEKLVYMLWKREDLPPEDFNRAMLGEAAKRLIALDPHELCVNLVDEHVAHTAAVRMTRFDPPMAGMLSLWLDMAEQRDSYERVLPEYCGDFAAYLVVESVPVVNTTRRVPLGQRTPGVNVVACIEKPERMGYEAWLDHWRGHHCKVAIETQCTFAYVRNVVVRALSENAPPWAGIVEEAFPAEAVTDPMLWYCADGDEALMNKNIATMMDSCQAFLDIDKVESNSMSEYRLYKRP